MNDYDTDDMPEAAGAIAVAAMLLAAAMAVALWFI